MTQEDKYNMRREIMASAVRIVARHGLEKTTTKLIAEEAGMNEAYLYRCFENKEDILREAFHTEDANFIKLIYRTLPVMRYEGITLEERCFLLWKSCWEFILKKPDDCLFYLRYYYSANCRMCAYERHMKDYKQLVDAIRFVFKPDTDMGLLMHQIFDTMLSFAGWVQTGRLPDNEGMMRITFRQVFSFVKINFNPELKDIIHKETTAE